MTRLESDFQSSGWLVNYRRPWHLLVLEHVGEPIKTLIETVTAGSASGLDVPRAVAKSVETELVGDLSNGHGIGKILTESGKCE